MKNRFKRLLAVLLEHRFGGAVLFVLAFLAISLATRVALNLQAGALLSRNDAIGGSYRGDLAAPFSASLPAKYPPGIPWSFTSEMHSPYPPATPPPIASLRLSWNPGLVAAYAWGELFDLGAAGWWSLPLVLALTLAPRSWPAGTAARRAAHAVIFTTLCLLLFVGMSEWLFWDEFGARFNFIAVDYLVYTNEVLGNIRESYPLPLILGGIALVAAGLHLATVRLGWSERWLANAAAPARARWRFAGLWTAAALALGLGLDEGLLPSWKNNYNREIAKNGPWSFVAAFRANHLDYERFYPTLPEDEAFARVRARLGRDRSLPAAALAADGHDLLRLVPAPRPEAPEHRLNVVQITVESLSAEFLGRFGDRRGWTPNLDELCARSLVFENVYATGTRTDRGMEALTLAVPPTPGRSLVKRPDNAGLFTLGSVFRARGYDTSFIYGGYGYFDNMNTFFGGNGYRVVDRTAFARDEITFANAWGACDEDLFARALREADREHAAGKPFFQFLMTTSNHRPFTFPDGRIDLPSKTSRRAGGVKYTDYAISKFLRDAASHPWFRDTVFVIVADHCAASAGRTELPVEKYHIPLIIHAPGGQIAPGVVTRLASQVDYAPTLLALLNWSYPSRFFGWDVTAPDAPPGRALVGNYQKLGLFDGQRLAILSPVRQSHAYDYRERDHALAPTTARAALELENDAIAYYQTASWLFKNRRQNALESPLPDHRLSAQ